MAILQKDIKLLWSRAAGRCSICRNELSHDKSSVPGALLIGEQAHIIAEEVNGPRGVSTLNLDERNSYHNLILLCPNHHSEIDRNVEDYPSERLYIIKSRHEIWVQQTLSKEANRSRSDLIELSRFLYYIDALKPLFYRLHHPVPAEEAREFFDDLQEVFHIHADFFEGHNLSLHWGLEPILFK